MKITNNFCQLKIILLRGFCSVAYVESEVFALRLEIIQVEQKETRMGETQSLLIDIKACVALITVTVVFLRCMRTHYWAKAGRNAALTGVGRIPIM